MLSRRQEHADQIFQRLVDHFYRKWPRPAPPPHRLRSCRLISHRGEHDNRQRLENTLPAFEAASIGGVWGIELDVRWTRDLVPVVFHDPDARRLFDSRDRIDQMPLDTLKKKFPLIPSLQEVIDRFGGRLHLMIEVKTEPYPNPCLQSRRMQITLGHLTPGEDFHLMSLDPGMFGFFEFLPATAFVPIARLRIDRFSRMAIHHQWGGLAGHYLLTTRRLIKRHHGLGQAIGTGFADSRRSLFREVARGVDWIFSNQAARMQTFCGEAQERNQR